MEQNKTTKLAFNKKMVALLLAVVLIIGATIGGTLAWLTATTTDVKNTFVVGDIGTLTLAETTTGTGIDGAYLIVPGSPITKNPKVSYAPTDETDVVKVPVYVFVKIKADGWAVSENTYTISAKSNDAYKVQWSVDTSDGKWKAVPDNDGVYYIEVAQDASLTDVSIISDDKITVSEGIISTDMAYIADAAGDITFSAYAIQQSGAGGVKFTAKDAWAAVSTSATP